MSTAVYPLAVWPENILQARLPANDNALRIEAFGRGVLSDSTTAQPGSPADGDVYIIAATHTGAQWATFTPGDVAIYRAGSWYAFAPAGKPVVNVNGSLKQWTGSAWASIGGGSSSPNVQAVTSASTVTPTFSNDAVKVTAQAAALLLANPTGSAVDSWGISIRIKDNGTARAITYDTQYRAIGVTLPATTVAGKTLYLAGVWNVEDTKLDIVSVGQQA